MCMKLRSLMDRSASISSATLLAAVLTALLIYSLWPASADARSSFWISSRDSNACIISAVVQHDAEFETRLQMEHRIDNPILKMDIHTRNPSELCSLLVMAQDGIKWRPLLCVNTIRGNIYKGYLVLPRQFELGKPIELRLGQRKISVLFLK